MTAKIILIYLLLPTLSILCYLCILTLRKSKLKKSSERSFALENEIRNKDYLRKNLGQNKYVFFRCGFNAPTSIRPILISSAA